MGAYSDRVIADGATHYWRLGEPSGTTAVDSVGGATGTISGGVTLGQPGALTDGDRAMTFDGTTGKVVTAANVTIPVVTTIEAWVKTPSPTVNRMILGTPGDEVLFYVHGTGPANVLAGINLIGSRVVADNQWHYVVAVLTNGQGSIYVDGVQDVIGTLTRTVPSTTPLTIATYQSTASWMLGALDEVAIYPRALTAPEIAAHYALRSARRAVDQLLVGSLFPWQWSGRL